ncbi:MAG TPA: hypothetical protein VIU33_02320 [Nitrospiria bacterium]
MMNIGFSLVLYFIAVYLTFRYVFVDMPAAPGKLKWIPASLQILFILAVLGMSLYEGRSGTGWPVFIGLSMAGMLFLAYMKESGHPAIRRLKELLSPAQLVFARAFFLLIFSTILFVYFYF